MASRLYELDRSSAQFPDQLDQLLHDKEHMECFQNLPEDELAELVNYLNDVRFTLRSRNVADCCPQSSSTSSIVLVSRSGSASRCCKRCAAFGGPSLLPTTCLGIFRERAKYQLHLADSVTHTRGRLKPAQVSVSKRSEYAPPMM